MSKSPGKEHKYGYEFGNTDRGILLAVLMASIFLTGLVGVTALDAAINTPEIAETQVKGNDTGIVDGSSGSLAQTGLATVGPAVGVIIYSDCFTITLIFIILVIVSYIIYRLLSWVEQKCRNLCKCKWYKPWCCLGRLFCWLVTITKWVALVVTIVFAIAVVVSFIYCIVHVLSGW